MTTLTKLNTHKLAIVSTFPPRQCGLATFTSDLRESIRLTGARVDVVAMIDLASQHEDGIPISDPVVCQVSADSPADYRKAADYLNRNGYDAISIQHEFGIFGGEAGSYLLTLVRNLRMPVVTTLHTVLEHPSTAQREVLTELISLSQRVVVMSNKGKSILVQACGTDPDRIDVIPHGCPDVCLSDGKLAKKQIGYDGKKLVLTFGLLSPDKGIEVAITAMAELVDQNPDLRYLVLGATHPQIKRNHGEEYRDSLKQLAIDLEIQDHIIFDDRYVSTSDLVLHLKAADVYLTPYLNPKQITSGTLAYALGCGKAIVSTPYWHAQEILADGNGVLVPFGDAEATAAAVSGLLMQPKRAEAIGKRAYAASRPTTWSAVGFRYADAFRDAIFESRPTLTALPTMKAPSPKPLPSEVDLTHVCRMTDDTGIIQHAKRALPLRAEGYCVDDNARALLLCARLKPTGETSRLAEIYSSFLFHAINHEAGTLHNFMGYDRRWLDEAGSEDSHGRAIWAAGLASNSQLSSHVRESMAELIEITAPTTLQFQSPRAWAFTILGLTALPKNPIFGQITDGIVRELAHRLMRLYDRVRKPGWDWMEDSLSYDNARLPESLIAAGERLGDPRLIAVGTSSLRWLNSCQLDRFGRFSPVGSDECWHFGKPKPIYDQQPVEAWAAIDANLTAMRVTGKSEWKEAAESAFGWFCGGNVRSEPVRDVTTGGCFDGLQRTGMNANQGAESTLSYLLGAVGISGIAEVQSFDRRRPITLDHAAPIIADGKKVA